MKELDLICREHQDTLYLDITLDMIRKHLEDDELLLDMYHLEGSRYGTVLVSRKLFESRITSIDGSYAELRKILSAYADEYEHIYICPDGELYNVSFERHIEGYEISYLSSPKGLLREDVGKQEGEIVSFVSPDFDSMSEEEDGQRGNKVGKLFGSYIEGVCIKETLGDMCQLFSRKEASSRNFLNVRNPKVLHVSTHGQYDHNEGIQLMKR